MWCHVMYGTICPLRKRLITAWVESHSIFLASLLQVKVSKQTNFGTCRIIKLKFLATMRDPDGNRKSGLERGQS